MRLERRPAVVAHHDEDRVLPHTCDKGCNVRKPIADRAHSVRLRRCVRECLCFIRTLVFRPALSIRMVDLSIMQVFNFMNSIGEFVLSKQLSVRIESHAHTCVHVCRQSVSVVHEGVSF